MATPHPRSGLLMRALRLRTTGSGAELVEVERPTPGPGQVLIRVGGAGACHSDLHLMHSKLATPRYAPPYSLGHENAGWVESVGTGVGSVAPGQAVAVHGAWGCGECSRCRVGAENYCEVPRRPVDGCGLGADGGMAEFLLVPDVRHLVPLPSGLSPAQAAPLVDAGLTPYHAVRRSLPKLGPTSTAVVIGVGGLGHMAVQFLKVLSTARVVAVDNRSEARELARSVGADVVVAAGDCAAEEILSATGGRGADLVLDCVGSTETLAVAGACARTLGDLTILGVAGGALPVSIMGPAYEVSVQTTYWGSRAELADVLELAARGLIRVTTTTFPLDQALDAYRALADGRIVGRAVVVPEPVPAHDALPEEPQ